MIAIFCFYNVSNGPQARLAFSKEFKHCNIITFDGDIYLAIEFDGTGLITRGIDAPDTKTLIRGVKLIAPLIAIVVVEVHKRAKINWKPYLVRSCNEIDRYISGVHIGFTFNPKHLYNKLFKYNHSNYDILYDWRR